MALFDYTAPNYNTVGETEEERRRREAEEAAKAAEVAGPAEPGPVKQTITYDPVTGEQRMKIEGSVQDLSPNNALTPTVSMPGQMPEATQVAEPVKPPELGLQKQFETPAVPAQPAAPTAMPAEQPRELPPGVQMVNGRLQLAAAAPEVAQVPTPGPGVQVAGAPGAPMPQLQTPAAQPAAQPSFTDMWTQAGQDPAKFLAIRNDTTLTPEQRKLAGREAARLSYMEGDKTEGEQAALATYQQAAASGDWNNLAKMMKAQNEEGSWGRRILFGMLGMEAAVKDEEAKLGIGAKWNSTTVTDDKGNSRNVLVKLRADGLPIEGYDATTGKQLGAKELAGVAKSNKDYDIVGGTYVSDTLKDKNGVPLVGSVYRSKTNPNDSFVQTSEGRKPLTGFRPQASGGSLDMQRVAQIQKQNVDLAGDWAKLQMRVQGAAPEAANKFLGEFNAKHRTNYALSQLGGLAPQISLETGKIVEAPALADQQAQTQQTQTQTQRTTQGATGQTGTTQGATGQQGAKTDGVATGGGAVSPAMLEQQMELAKKQGESNIETSAVVQREKLKPPAAEEGKQVATDMKNQRFADSTYTLVQPLADLIRKSTGSGIGAGADKIAALLGKSTTGAEAIAELDVLTYPLISNIPRFEGPQGQRDVEIYERAAGDLNNPTKPVKVRLAALNAMVTMLKRYDKAGNNDWTFSAAPTAAGGIKIIKREKVQ